VSAEKAIGVLFMLGGAAAVVYYIYCAYKAWRTYYRGPWLAQFRDRQIH
jgi:hypothetical protein